MRRLFALLFVAFCSSDAKLFTNVYPNIKAFYDGGDPGDPLFLTPLINKGDLASARDLARVNDTEINQFAESYAGYLTVNETYNSNMFFWYFKAKVAPETSPVVLWLQGGPGASSLYGLFTENGPFSVSKKLKLVKRPYSWHLNHHLIYIDNPVGTGFSFTDNDLGYAKNEVDVGENLYRALSQFFTIFDELKPLPFFVTGESYGGKYVPAISYTIHTKNKNAPADKKINLSGLTIGNGLCDPMHQLKYGDYLFQLGLIDSHGLKSFHEYEKKGVDFIKKKDFQSAFEIFDTLLNADKYKYGSLFFNLTGFNFYFNYLLTEDPKDYFGDYLLKSETREAIHVGNRTFNEGGTVEEHLKLDVMDTIAPWLSELLAHYRVVIYNGQLDIIVAYPLTVNYLSKLSFVNSTVYHESPRYIWKVENEIAGYVREGGNLVEVLVRNAGHMVPGDQPKWALDLLMRLTHGKGFKK